MKASLLSDHLLPASGTDRTGDPISVTVLDGEALLPGPRGLVAITISVRLLNGVEIWLYAAESALEHPARGLWRWRQGNWETLHGGQGFAPRALVTALVDGGKWVKPPPAQHGEQVRGLLRLAGRTIESAHGTAAGIDA